MNAIMVARDSYQGMAPRRKSKTRTSIYANIKSMKTAQSIAHLQNVASAVPLKAGIAPASRDASVMASTCVAVRLIVGRGAPSGRVPFGLSHHEFNPSRNGRLGSDEPALASPGGASGRRPAARPLAAYQAARRREGVLSAANGLVGFLRGLLTNLGTPPDTSVIRSILAAHQAFTSTQLRAEVSIP
jgi:hypothetical protein